VRRQLRTDDDEWFLWQLHVWWPFPVTSCWP